MASTPPWVAPVATRKKAGRRSGSFRSAAPAMYGSRGASGRSSGASTTRGYGRARRCECFRCRIGLKSMCGSTSKPRIFRWCRSILPRRGRWSGAAASGLWSMMIACRCSRARHRNCGGSAFALLLDSREDERQHGVTIDVAYRFFATPRRAFIVADTPGHEQYTRNMVTGASTADLAVLLIDARKGLLAQTRRHSLICSLLGIRHILLAVNKLDLVEFDRAVFARIAEEYRRFAADLDFASLTVIPISARHGDNVIERR